MLAKSSWTTADTYQVDTCCIDKKDSVKLSEAINSMFSWYQHSARCYVYLADVEDLDPVPDDMNETEAQHLLTMYAIFRLERFCASKWFTRGWTLQELLAPAMVEFFSRDGDLLGNRNSLAVDIHETTGIPAQALQETYVQLSNFSIDERMAWAKGRETKRQEDAAYSLLGIFGVHMSPIYGEGRENAFIRLRWEIERKATISQTAGVMATNEGLPNISHPSIASQQPVKAIDVGIQAFDVGDRYSHQSSSDSIPKSSEKEMKLWWEKAMAANMSTTSAYEKAAVLLVSWEKEPDDWWGASMQVCDRNLHIYVHVLEGIRQATFHRHDRLYCTRKKILLRMLMQGQVNRLNDVFHKRFGFHTETVILEASRDPQQWPLLKFIKQNDGPHNLLIVYYTGQSVLHTDHVLTPDLHWHVSLDILRSNNVNADVLMIVDSACDIDLTLDRGAEIDPSCRPNQAKQLELLCACGSDQTTASPGPKSFTYALISALDEFANEKTGNLLSTFRLNQRICGDPQREDYAPSILWSSSPNENHISLGPIRKAPIMGSQRQEKAKGYLKLGLELSNDALSQAQIENLTQALVALGREQGLGLCDIDWLGFNVKGRAVK
jgi:hypothetical protein